ncbi:DNA mismatch repair endonuclease MutL [Gloeothece verrucosa]|uniref:DNA mismatch repair protein MutL n=1 Tax=Gloeothece verrucosa (strain PCC 7822) TaxID=497965 RepID=E0UIK5_GLOV7|nr:DNA mismatch repair endonuclease MutL [Gloeothece verrucosa]ADN12199.1 DNA mismatch repair protein MutL [Gloeothece verrucosa PCC 7822]
MNIKSLPPDVINLIAAGEVIDSLGAVVRELVENALDAGATRIVISLYPDLWWIQVADNGRGMSLEDLKRCSNAHSTSKIRSRDDLWNITSLGFRGEALHSIAQVAILEVASRFTIGHDAGWRVRYNAVGEAESLETAAIAPGTIVTVSNLFGNLPVRRKGLPPMTQQLKAIQTLIHHIALCHPHVTWCLEQNDRNWFNISPGKSALQILPQLLKRVHQNDLHLLIQTVETPALNDLQTNLPPMVEESKVELVIGLPDRCHRRRADWVKVAINGRMVRLPELEQSIFTAFARTLPRDRFPVCFVHVKTCPSHIDWNRHPAKTEIYLHSLAFWQEKIAQSIDEALKMNGDSLSDKASNHRVVKLLKASEEKSPYKVDPKPQTQTRHQDSIGLLDLQAVAQVRNTYIVAEHSNGLWLIEQHIAHERVLYEQLQDDWKIVFLDTPIVLNQLTSSQVEQLQRLGLEIEPFGEALWAVRSAPEMLSKRQDCSEALIELSWGGDLQTAQVATACRSAIRNGTTLSLAQMQSILDQWKRTRNPRTCPHGRPIFLSLEETSLARFFRRHWVIGKSHGI